MTIRPSALLLICCLPLFAAEAFGQNDGKASIHEIETVLNDESTRATLSPEQWNSFGDRLTEALESDNAGVQRSALRLAAYHGDRLQMGRRATVSAVRFYRNDPDPYVRKLAVVAIARINHPWGIDFLTRSLDFEDSVDIEKVMRSELNHRETKDQN